MKQSRFNELTAVSNREVFEEYPYLCDSGEAKVRWLEYRKAYNLAAGLESDTAFPLQLDFELNSTCNLRCRFCLHGNERVKRRVLGFDLFKAAIDEGQRHGLVSIKLNYINEPLIIKDLERYIRYARSAGVINVYFATNGTLLTPTRSRSLIQAGVTKIMISIDAITAETYHAMRGADVYDRVVENILEFIHIRDRMTMRGERGPVVRVNFLKTDQNIHEAEAFIEYWTPIADAIGFQDKIELPGVETDKGDHDSWEKDLTDFRCSFPYKMMVVDADGNILPCCTFSGREMPMGKVDESGDAIERAWNSDQMRELKRLHLEGRWRENPICKHCVGGCS